MAGEEAGPAGDVEGVLRRQRRDCMLQLAYVGVPLRPVELVETAEPAIPLVVLRGARVVVGLHAFLEYAACRSPSSRCRTSPRDATATRSRRCGGRSRRMPRCSTFMPTPTTTA